MFEWIVTKLINFFSVMLHGISWLFAFISNHTWALFVTIWATICGIFTSIINTIERWVDAIVTPVDVSGGLLFGNCLSDVIDAAILKNLGEDVISCCVKDLLYCLNFGSFFTSMVSIFLPVVISVFVYRLVKSWIPTVSGS